MSDQYLVHLPDGTEYGPVERSVLDAWRAEGRLPADTLVWPYGAPEWLTVEAALGPAASAAPAAPPPPDPTPASAPAPAKAAAPAPVKTAAAAPAKTAAAAPAKTTAPAPVKPAAAPAPARSVVTSAAKPVTPTPVPTAAPGPAGKGPAKPVVAVPRPRPAHADSTAPGSLAAGESPLAALVTPAAREPRRVAQAGAATAAAKVASPAAAHAGPAAKPSAPAARSAKPAVVPAAGAGTPPAKTAQATEANTPSTWPPSPIPKLARQAGAARRGIDLRALRPLLLAALGLALVAAALAGLWVVLRPYIARRWEIASVNRQATPDRRLEDRELGLVAELPTGWVALRPGSAFVPSRSARMRLAHPSLGAFAAVEVAPRPRLMDALDAGLDGLLLERLPRQPSVRERGRADVRLGRGQGRLVRTTWQDGLTPMLGATVAWADGYVLFSLDAWAPAAAGDEFFAQVEALCGGLRTTGLIESRVNDAVERLALDVPELRKDALRLLVAETMSRGDELAGVPAEALRTVSRGLSALAPGEAAELRAIYQLIWEPVPEAERVHLASLMSAIQAGREVPGGDIQPLRGALKAGVLALPAEQLARLQELSGRAVRRALAGP